MWIQLILFYIGAIIAGYYTGNLSEGASLITKLLLFVAMFFIGLIAGTILWAVPAWIFGWSITELKSYFEIQDIWDFFIGIEYLLSLFIGYISFWIVKRFQR